jgi:hypothetical protein
MHAEDTFFGLIPMSIFLSWSFLFFFLQKVHFSKGRIHHHVISSFFFSSFLVV